MLVTRYHISRPLKVLDQTSITKFLALILISSSGVVGSFHRIVLRSWIQRLVIHTVLSTISFGILASWAIWRCVASITVILIKWAIWAASMHLPLSISTQLVLVCMSVLALVVSTTNYVLSVNYPISATKVRSPRYRIWKELNWWWWFWMKCWYLLRLWFDGAMPTLEFVCHFRWLHTYKLETL